ncbi:hypothetical protein DN524_32125, partial [Burkholderia multivorans]
HRLSGSGPRSDSAIGSDRLGEIVAYGTIQGTVTGITMGRRTPRRANEVEEMDVADGRSLREATPRSSHAELDLPPDRDPVGVICRQNESRLPDLLGIRTQRLAESPFSYFRGAAAQ